MIHPAICRHCRTQYYTDNPDAGDMEMVNYNHCPHVTREDAEEWGVFGNQCTHWKKAGDLSGKQPKGCPYRRIPKGELIAIILADGDLRENADG